MLTRRLSSVQYALSTTEKEIHMATKRYAEIINQTKNDGTPQTEAIPGREERMSKNEAGGVTFTKPEELKLRMWLVMGSNDGNYYVSGDNITKDAAGIVMEYIHSGRTLELLRIIQELNTASKGKASSVVRKTESIFALAMVKVFADGSHDLAQLYEVIKEGVVVSTVSQLTEWLNNIYMLNGGKLTMGNGMKRAVEGFLTTRTGKNEEQSNRWLAYQLTKYRGRTYGDHRINTSDILRLAHAKPANKFQDAMFFWVLNREGDNKQTLIEAMADDATQSEAIDYIYGFELLQRAKTDREVVELIHGRGYTWEMIPSQFMKSVDVLRALMGLPTEYSEPARHADGNPRWSMPFTALLRNVPRFAAAGLFEEHDILQRFEEVLTGDKAVASMRWARVHPIRVLQAYKGYSSGSSRNLKWEVIPTVKAMLEQAFYLSFGALEPTGKRTLHAVDCSYSMTSSVLGMEGFSAREASAVLMMAAIRSEKLSNLILKGFNDTLSNLPITPNDSLDAVQHKMDRFDWGSTDCSLPMYYALDNNVDVEAFVMYTDNETWAGRRGHPQEALEKYRASSPSRANAKLIVWSMCYNEASVADPEDALSMELIGFDANAIDITRKFITDSLL